MPAVSRKQIGFIMSNPDKFGGKKKALSEWVEPTKGKKLPEKVKTKPTKGMGKKK